MCLFVCVYWVSAKENAVWMLVYPITALTQLFVLQGHNCLPVQVLKC